MESTVKMKDMNCNATSVGFSQMIVTTVGVNLTNSDSFSIMPPPHHDMVSTNSIELNAAASLSDDSGVPLTTNSSISSGDSYRLGVCKFGIEMGESDGEVSQFDSLDNCSEGGMSAENFNTLKKGPLAPIDPLPEFQDSPHTTLVRSLSKSVVNRRWTSSHSSIDHLKENFCTNNVCGIDNSLTNTDGHVLADKSLKDCYAMKKYIYSSDSMLNTHTDNIYDEPNNIISSSLGNSVDLIESDSSSPLPPPPPPVSIVKIKQTLCPFYQDHTRYFKAILSEQDHQKSAAQRFDLSGLSDIHDYDLYYGAKRNTYHQYENTLQRRYLYSPHNHFHSCHNHYHTGGFCGNRPNSRNSLNSRLSSSHNSLSVSSANKPDDSIFITQAMSHDALLIREITDFYNVPVDSDIYAFPVDMIPTDKLCYNQRQDSLKLNISELKDAQQFATQQRKMHHQKSHRRHNRSKRKKYSASNFSEGDDCNDLQLVSAKSNNRALSDGSSSCVHHAKSLQEPLHMSLDTVKQFYHTLYSNANSKTCNTKASNETLCSVASSRCRSNTRTKEKNAISRKKSQKTCSSDNDSINNNVNVNLLNNNQKNQSQQSQALQMQNNRNKQSLQPNEKKSQFTLNLKQRFCSLFRFRRNHNRCQNSVSEADEQSGREQSCNTTHHSDKRKKVQSRALPPLPRKDEASPVESDDKPKKAEARSFQFTSSIEKVKDYGWYWGPLSSEAAEKVLSNEPDGSFIVRDSSDDHYIFSLSFKLNNCVRHVRIEQDQGTFSFGSYAKFKSQTITEFIEKAVEHSRSGRYLFFLHRRPEHGPMRVQLTNPVSRFKHVQSLQHMCRFVILKAVIRKDLIQTLPLPRRLLDYLNYKHCYSEQIESDSSHSQISEEGSI